MAYNSIVSASILTTKLHFPSYRAGLVSRPHLVDRLHAGLSRRLTLISAPAGYGKTTLISEWIHRIQERSEEDGTTLPECAWLSLDEEDNDPGRFLTYLIAAMSRSEKHDRSVGIEAFGMAQSPQPESHQAVLTSLINDLARVRDGTVLVIDDYHVIDSQAVDSVLLFLLEHKPCSLHLVVLTRSDPPLPLARFRAGNDMTELRAADLRFSIAESTIYLNQLMGLSLRAEDIASLETRTEGWIAGLHLAAVSLQGEKDIQQSPGSFGGTHRFVMDYLLEEVLVRQPKQIQDFLLNTAVLNRLTGALCDVVTGQDDGQSTLEMLERANLFITPLDNERRWYRYHHLFGELLARRREREDPDGCRELHIRAAAWWKENGFRDQAIEHAIRATDHEWAATMMEDHIDDMWQRGEGVRAWRWLSRLPEEVSDSKPLLCVMRGYYLECRGERAKAEHCLRIADKLMESATSGDRHSQADQLIGRAATIRALIGSNRGDLVAIVEHAQRALDYLPPRDSVWRALAAITLGDLYSFTGDMKASHRARSEAVEACKIAGNDYFTMTAIAKLSSTLREQGLLRKTVKVCLDQLSVATKIGLSNSRVAGLLMTVAGEALAEMNNLDQALMHARKGVALVEQGENLTILCWCYLFLIKTLYACSDFAGVEETVQRIAKIAADAEIPPWIMPQAQAWQARVWVSQGNVEPAVRWMESLEFDIGELPDDTGYFLLIEAIVAARVLAAQGRLSDASGLLGRLLASASKHDRVTRAIEILALLALTRQEDGDRSGAREALRQALALAKPEGFVRVFVDEGPPMAGLLYEAAGGGADSSYARTLLAAFPAAIAEEKETPGAIASNSALIEPLSERELDVLRLIGEGLTNQQIGTKLFISVYTVKAHARSVYAKLDSHTRTQAVNRARGLGVLPPV
jgi:LuxR family transcriptional regulator, maltose regulon positive regulatory protein